MACHRAGDEVNWAGSRRLPAALFRATLAANPGMAVSQIRSESNNAGAFVTTHWSVVLRAGADTGAAGAQALETLCRAYWYPLYAYVRRLGHAPSDAQDLTQSFFAYLLEKRLVAKADPEIGHFRSFLLGALKNFLANEWRRQQAAKRGGNEAIISFDAHTAEERYALEPATSDNPQKLFEQAWAVAVLDQAIHLLQAEHAAAGKAQHFAELHVFLQGERGQRSYAEVGSRLAMSEGAVKVAVHRLRQRYRELLRSAVAHTIGDPLEVDAELRHLLHVLSD